VYVFARMRVC